MTPMPIAASARKGIEADCGEGAAPEGAGWADGGCAVGSAAYDDAEGAPASSNL